MITRKDFMEHRATFAEYYSEIAHDAHIRITDEKLIARCEHALASGDEHLNTIPLSLWDAMGVNERHALIKPFKDRGDFWSLAGSVCVFKQAMRNEIEARKVR